MCWGADGPALDMGRAACLGEDLLNWAGSVEAWFPIGPVGREDLSVTSYCRKSGRPCWAFRNCATSSCSSPGAQALFSSEKISDFGTVALSFVFDIV